jgi:predicted nucleic acid-binding protein
MGGIAAGEAQAKETDDAVAIAALLEASVIQRQAIAVGSEELKALVRDFNLHAGEAEAVLLARRRSAVCGTDDGRAIRCCKVLGIRFTTAVGLLIALTETRVVESALAVERLLKLERAGRYHPRILEDAANRIRVAGEGGEAK